AARGCALPGNTVIYSSDFSRAWQTAEIVRAQLGALEIVLAEALRERFFRDGRHVSVPVHGARPLPAGTLASICRQVGAAAIEIRQLRRAGEQVLGHEPRSVRKKARDTSYEQYAVSTILR